MAAAKVNPVCRSAGGKRGFCSEEGQFRDEMENASRCLTPSSICPLTWANQLDLGEERSSGVAHSTIDSEQSHNWPVKRKGAGSAWLCRGATASRV